MPVQLNNPLLRSFAVIPQLGLGIKRAGQDFIHVGFLYRNSDNAIALSHLAWHHDLKSNDNPNDSYYWLEPELHETVCLQIAVLLQHVAEENNSKDVPYSIEYRGQSVDQSGKYMPSGPGAYSDGS